MVGIRWLSSKIIEIMNKKPLISAIIIFLNEERFLDESIQSVFSQTYEHWELLLVDDGSTDKSTKIAKNYSAKFPQKVCYFEHEGHQNRGMSASRNLGIRRAKGDYIAFLDADDIWLSPKLGRQVEILMTWPEAAMVYGRTLIWNNWIGNSEEPQHDYTLDLGVTPNNLIRPPTLYYFLLQNKVQTPTTCNVMIRRSVFDDIGLFEEEFKGMYEDQAFFAKVHLKAPVFVADECWAKYRQHPDSCSFTSEMQSDYYRGRMPFLTWLAEYLSKQGLTKDSEVWQALQRELWVCQHPRLGRWLSSIRQFYNKMRM